MPLSGSADLNMGCFQSRLPSPLLASGHCPPHFLDTKGPTECTCVLTHRGRDRKHPQTPLPCSQWGTMNPSRRDGVPGLLQTPSEPGRTTERPSSFVLSSFLQRWNSCLLLDRKCSLSTGSGLLLEGWNPPCLGLAYCERLTRGLVPVPL